jgi:Phosphoglucomutase/phosphomannomutase, C-terminal domain
VRIEILVAVLVLTPDVFRLEILWKFDGCGKVIHLRRRVLWHRFRPYPREGRVVGSDRYVALFDNILPPGDMVPSAWLNILAAANAKSPNKLLGINDLLIQFYETYGRSFFTRYDYEEVTAEGAHALVAHLNKALNDQSLNDTTHISHSTSTKFTISRLYDFDYTDPIDKSVSKNQGQVILFDDGSRVVFRLSGTGSQGATVRMYVERYLGPEAGEKELARDASDGLKGLIEVALAVSKLKEFLGRDKPTVITVCIHMYSLFPALISFVLSSKVVWKRLATWSLVLERRLSTTHVHVYSETLLGTSEHMENYTHPAKEVVNTSSER